MILLIIMSQSILVCLLCLFLLSIINFFYIIDLIIAINVIDIIIIDIVILTCFFLVFSTWRQWIIFFKLYLFHRGFALYKLFFHIVITLMHRLCYILSSIIGVRPRILIFAVRLYILVIFNIFFLIIFILLLRLFFLRLFCKGIWIAVYH